MADQSTQLVQKLWNYCNILRDDLSACGHAQADGLAYLLARGLSAFDAGRRAASGDYPAELLRTGYEQLTFLLFLKMADEQSGVPFNKRSPDSGAHVDPDVRQASKMVL